MSDRLLYVILDESPKRGSLEPIIFKAWSPGAQTVLVVVFLNFKIEPLKPWSTCN